MADLGPPLPPLESLPAASTEDVYTVVETIYAGTSTCITRASHGNKTYIVKSNIKLLLHQKKLRKYFKEYSIGSSVDSPFVVKYTDFKRLGYGFAIVMEDIGGKPLKSVIPQNGMSLDDFLEIACCIVQGLGAVHDAGVTHKDINPTNIVVNMETKALNIIDFGLASQLHRNEVSPMTSPVVMQGTFMYMSPEQTGRMNRTVDFRTDFYSLGVTFYEMLTGEPPYPQSVDPLDLIYKHMAVHPTSVVELRPGVGRPVSDIVAKLISKNAEDRYQDSKGLLADLLEVQKAIRLGAPLVNFVAGSRDLLRQLHVSQKLYGREDQVRILSQNFELICDGSPLPASFVLVHGVSGVGKTLLVHEVHKPLARSSGYYISGKFEQFMSANPYSALFQALRQLVQQILTESEENLELWRWRILQGVGSLGHIIVDIIPELELIIGPQPPVQDVGAVETLHRFKDLICSFLFSLACKDHPLVIFLDDLQWADTNTLALLVSLLTPTMEQSESRYLLIVGAYRDNEVTPEHPLSVSIREIERKGGRVEDLHLLPLSESEVIQLVEDTFNLNLKSSFKVDAAVLGHLVHIKTQGNPFFVNQLLVTLHKDGHIRPVDVKESTNEDSFSGEQGGWVCNMEAIQDANYTSNVVDFMIASLRGLPIQVQTIIGMAATIGAQFDLSLLTRMCSCSEQQLTVSLRGAVRGGFLIPNSDEVHDGPMTDGMESGEIVLMNAPHSPANSRRRMPSPSPPQRSLSKSTYRFAHDRIQQAAACLLSPEETVKLHIKLAEQQLCHCGLNGDREFSQNLLSIVNHLNLGYKNEIPPLVPLPPRSDHSISAASTSYLPFTLYSVASLNFLAATKAKGTNAYNQAIEYTDMGIRLLETNIDVAWTDQHSLCMGLYQLRATLQNLTGNFAEPPCEYLLDRANTVLEKVAVYILLHDRHEAQSNLPEAVKMVTKGLELLGVNLPDNADDQKAAFLSDITVVQAKVSAFANIGDIAKLRECTDPTQLSIMKMLSIVWLAAYMMGKQHLAGYVSSQIVLRSIEYGMCAETGKAIVIFVMHSLCFNFDYLFLNELAKTGVYILDTKYSHIKALCGAAYVMYAVGISTWVYPLADCLKYIETAYQLNRQAGNYLWMTYGGHYLFEYPLMSGMNLKDVAHEFEKIQPFWKEMGVKFGMYAFMEIAASPIWVFMGVDKDILGDEKYEDSIFAKIPLYTAAYNSVKMYCTYVMGDREGLLRYTDIASELMPICFTGIYRHADSEAIAGLVYLDWVSRSPLAQEIYGNPKKPQRARLPVEELEYDSEELDRDAQVAKLKKRLEQVGVNLKHLLQVSCFCEANFLHKALLIRAELARIALICGSTAIYTAVGIDYNDPLFRCGNWMEKKHDECTPNTQDFEEAMGFYETAIDSAKRHGFQHFEAIGLELYGMFWLTAPVRPKERFAHAYLTESVLVYERWGATAKADRLREKCIKISPLDPIRTISQPRKIHRAATNSSLDLDVIVQASQTISNEVDFDTLVVKMVKAIVENANAQHGTLFVVEGEDGEESTNLWVSAEYSYLQRSPKRDERDKNDPVHTLVKGITLLSPKKPLAEWQNGPLSVVNYVKRTLKPVVLQCAHDDAQFGADKYISVKRVKSLLCMPILLKSSLKGVMYMENNLCDGIYTKNHVDLLQVLTSQMAISMENIRFLHKQIEKKSEQLRFEQLQREEKAQRARADAAEKYKLQLENFVDMICHEIRNPLNGIFGNTDLIFYYLETIEEILQKLKLQKPQLNGSGSEIILERTLANLKTESSPPNYKKPKLSPSVTEVTTSKAEAQHVLEAEAEKDQASSENLLVYLLEQVNVSVKSIQKCAEHQKCMTDDVLQLSRLRSHKLTISQTYYHPWEMITTAMSIFKPQAEAKGLYLQLNVEGENYENTELLGDSVRVYQIVSNLLSNALKFTHRGGITISFSVIDTGTTTASEPASPRKPVNNLLRTISANAYNHSNNNTSNNSGNGNGSNGGGTGGNVNNGKIPSISIPSLSPSNSPLYPSPYLNSPSHSPPPSSPSSPSYLPFPTHIPGTTPRHSPKSTTMQISPRYETPTPPEIPQRDFTMCILTIMVQDSGIGMTRDEQARIFKRFSQANNRTSHEYGGSGLGLAICRKLAKLMQGTISLHSEKGKGSTFSLVIPCRKALPLPIPRPPSPPLQHTTHSPTQLLPSSPLQRNTTQTSFLPIQQPPHTVPASSPPIPIRPEPTVPSSSNHPENMLHPIPTTPHTVLIVEDNLVNQTVLSRVLKIKGFAVELANNGSEGLNKFKEAGLTGNWFDFVLMDVQMPVMDGITSTQLMRKFEVEMGKEPSVIIGLSGNARDEYRHTAIGAGMTEYITKPYHKEVLYSLLEKKGT